MIGWYAIFFPTDLALRCLELNINIGWYWDFLNNFFYFHFATGNCWICIFSHLHSRSYFEDHCVWVFLPFGCLPPQRMEHFRFCNCSSRVSLFNQMGDNLGIICVVDFGDWGWRLLFCSLWFYVGRVSVIWWVVVWLFLKSPLRSLHLMHVRVWK